MSQMPKTPSPLEIQDMQAEEFAEQRDEEPEPSHSLGFIGFIDQVSTGTAEETRWLHVDTDIAVSLVLNPTKGPRSGVTT